MTVAAVLAWQRAVRRAERRVKAAERMRDLTATIAVAAMCRLTDDQLAELRGELLAGREDANHRERAG